jgi:hypothetical protein
MRAMDLLKVLAMPFQLTSLLFVAFTSFFLGFILGSGNFIITLIGLWMAWITLTWLTRYAFRMIDDAANGVRSPAVADVDMINPFGDARCWVHPLLALLLIVVHLWLPALPVAPTLIGAALLLPASIGASAMSGRSRDALNPLEVLRTIQGMGPWYALPVLAAAGSAALGVLLARAFGPGWLLFASLEMLLLLTYACIGGVVYQRRIELGFAPRISPERVEEVEQQRRTARRQQMLDELFRDLRGQHTPHAIASASQWLKDAQSHELVGDMQAIIAAGARWNEPRRFAGLLRGLLPWLLERRELAVALAAADAGLAAQAGFAPADEQSTATLVEYALQSGRRRTGARLLENFLTAQGSDATPGPRLNALRNRLLTPA